MKAIKIKTNGFIKIKSINTEKLYNKYEIYAPLTDKKYPLSVAVKENSLFSNEQPNHTANNLFKRNDFYGDIYIILENPEDYDSEDSQDNDEKEEYEINKTVWTFENLLLDIHKNTLVC